MTLRCDGVFFGTLRHSVIRATASTVSNPSATLELDIGPSGASSYLLIDHSTEERRFEEASDVSEEQALDLVGRVLGG